MMTMPICLEASVTKTLGLKPMQGVISLFIPPQQMKYKTKWTGFKIKEMEPNEKQDRYT